MLRPPAPRLATATVVVALALLAAACSSGGNASTPPASIAVTPTTEAPGQGCDPKVEPFPYHVAWAAERGELTVYEAPDVEAGTRTYPNPRLSDSEPPLEQPLAFLVKSEPKTEGCAWVEVDLPTRPNGSTGWVKRSDIKMEGHVYRIEVHLSEFTIRAFQNEDLVFEAPIATAKDNTPTPGGTYFTTELIKTAVPTSIYGTYAFGLSGFSDTLTTFNGGQGQLGIHGTNDPSAIGTQVSHGCIRLRNEDIEQLVDTLDTWLGIPVQVIA